MELAEPGVGVMSDLDTRSEITTREGEICVGLRSVQVVASLVSALAYTRVFLVRVRNRLK